MNGSRRVNNGSNRFGLNRRGWRWRRRGGVGCEKTKVLAGHPIAKVDGISGIGINVIVYLLCSPNQAKEPAMLQPDTVQGQP
ncbi:hypothetical protein Tco_0765218 [Tanacetum coccineum]